MTDGNVLTRTDGDGNADSLYLQWRQSGAERRRSTTVHGASQLHEPHPTTRTATNPAHRQSARRRFGYDGLGEQTSVKAGTGATTQTVYDGAGNVQSVTDADGNTTAYTYNAAGQVLTETVTDVHGNPVRTRRYSYDLDGNLLSKIDGDGRTIVYSYDGAGRELSETWFDASGNLTDKRQFTYDDNGNVLTASDNAGSYTLTYVSVRPTRGCLGRRQPRVGRAWRPDRKGRGQESDVAEGVGVSVGGAAGLPAWPDALPASGPAAGRRVAPPASSASASARLAGTPTARRPAAGTWT